MIKHEIEIRDIKILPDPKSWLRRSNLLLPALTAEEYFKLDDRSMSDTIVFTKELVKLIKYYNLSDNSIDNWSGFLQNIDPINISEHVELINKFETNQLMKGDIIKLSAMCSPHEVLFLAFLSLMTHTREQMNCFSSRYLNYYYRDYLGFSQKANVPAKAHVIFELNKDASSITLGQGTLLSAGTDSKREEVFYELDEDVTVTTAQLTTIQTLSGIDKKDNGLVLTTIFDKEKEGNFASKVFKTFGEQAGEAAQLGFAISSSLLATSSGSRTLTLTLTFEEEITNDIKDIFTFYVTGAKRWIKLAPTQDLDTTDTEKTKKIEFTLDETITNAEEYDAELYFEQKDPILKAVVKDFTAYQQITNISLKDITLTLEANNITNLIMANDDTPLNSSSKVIHPFGLQPIQGSSFYFTHPDFMGKNIVHMKLGLKWVGLPTSGFKTYYKDYDSAVLSSTFTTELNRSNTFINAKNKLFKLASDDETSLINTTTIDIPGCSLTNLSSLAQTSSNPFDWPEYFVLSLEHDFFHSMYPKVLAKASVDQTTLPNIPYTPTCSSISIDSYIATDIISISDTNKEQFPKRFKIFGPWVQDSTNKFPTYTDFGYLFLGITDLEVNQPLNILWQASDGVASDDNNVHWEYWAKDNKWIQFKSLNKDATANLSGSGVISFHIPEDISNQYPAMQSDQYWIRAIMQNNPNNDDQKVLDTLDIKLNATIAKFSKQNNTQDDFSVLNPETIKNLVKEIPYVKKVIQPYLGFDGKEAENEQEFIIRSSSRLKHKNRAITSWDYERLVLAEFPEVDMVRTVSNELGELIIEIITSTTNKEDFRVIPLASEQLLDKIAEYLENYKLATVRLKAQNVELRSINIKTAVCFKEENQNLRLKLEQDLRWFLSPWSNSQAVDLDKNNNTFTDIYAPEVVNFLKTRSYILQVVSLQQC